MTAIEWTDITDNIFTVKGGGWWCRKISEGCNNCYAAALNQNSFFGGNHLPYTGHAPELILHTELIAGWAKMKKPKRHFVASMTDIFGEWVKLEDICTFLDGMYAAKFQTFQMLTKRPHVAARRIKAWLQWRELTELPENMWIGTSVENQKWAEIRIPQLLSIPARRRFLSCEPLLEPLDLTFKVNWGGKLLRPVLFDIDWIIIGGESGPKARMFNIEWARSILRQCRGSGTKCFVKQVGSDPRQDYEAQSAEGEKVLIKNGPIKFNHSKGGDPMEWAPDLRVREFPGVFA